MAKRAGTGSKRTGKRARKKAPASLKRGTKKKSAARSQGEKEQHCWTYDDLTPIVTKSENAIQQDVRRGHVDPYNLESVVTYIVRNALPEYKQKILPYVLMQTNTNPSMPRRRS